MAPNVLYLVLDCLRADAITPKTAPNLTELAEKNCSFEECIAPADWSLPSHASIFTGEWAHEHHCYWREQKMSSLPLVESFNRDGFDLPRYAHISHGLRQGTSTRQSAC